MEMFVALTLIVQSLLLQSVEAKKQEIHIHLNQNKKQLDDKKKRKGGYKTHVKANKKDNNRKMVVKAETDNVESNLHDQIGDNRNLLHRLKMPFAVALIGLITCASGYYYWYYHVRILKPFENEKYTIWSNNQAHASYIQQKFKKAGIASIAMAKYIRVTDSTNNISHTETCFVIKSTNDSMHCIPYRDVQSYDHRYEDTQICSRQGNAEFLTDLKTVLQQVYQNPHTYTSMQDLARYNYFLTHITYQDTTSSVTSSSEYLSIMHEIFPFTRHAIIPHYNPAQAFQQYYTADSY